MAIRKKHDYRLRITDNMGNVSYAVRENGKVNYFTKDLVPLSLTSATENAAELRFALEDAHDGRSARIEATKIVRKGVNVAEH